MSLHAAARHISTKGRGSDSMLVHMTPKEVNGLQALAKASGGSLTINPDTGLVEAGFLSDILPVIAAAGLTYLTAGAAAPALAGALGTAGMSAGAAATAGGILAGAGSGALINGGMAALQGKDVGKAALSGGIGGAISGGLGAYGDANVFGVGAPPAVPAGEITQAGAQTVGQAAAMPPSVPSVDVNAGLSQGVTGATPPSSPGMAIPEYSSAAYQNPYIPPNTTPAYQSSIANESLAEAANNQALYNTPATSPNLAGQAAAANAVPKLDPYEVEGLSGMARDTNTALNPGGMTKPGVLSGNYYQGLGSGGVDTAQKLGIQALPVMSMLDEQQSLVPVAEEPSRLKRISPNFRAQEPATPNPYYKARYAAGGGLMDLRPQTNFANPAASVMGTSQYDVPTDPMSGNIAQRMAGGGNTTKKKRATLTSDRSLAAMDPFEAGLANLNNARYGANMAGINSPSAMTRLGEIPTAAGGGLSHLGSYSDGGRMLKGPGDGMSDNIPAMIGSKQPARLADGEFVVPADVVSHLGNGSTDAGAKKLYAMMDKVRRARTGKKKQAPAVNTRRLMPA